MQPVLRLAALTLFLLHACETTAVEERPAAPDTGGFAERIAELEYLPGIFDLYLDRDAGTAWLALPPAGERGVMAECLYVEGLTTGLGSNPVGLDRGQLGPSRVVHFRRVGGKVLVEVPNLQFRALSSDARELAATRESFATSVLWAGDVAETSDDGRTLVDITGFCVRDAHGVAGTLSGAGGSWSLDAKRSALDPDACLAFPDNLEFEALLTFSGSSPGRDVRGTAPDPNSVTLVQHHSLLRLPDDGYRPRRFDPRSGAMATSFLDYAAGLDEAIDTRWAVRHRLEKIDPTAARSRVVEPIVYYVDRGAPEPVQSALIEGASWWADAFDAAGFVDAFRVELLPEGAHSLDARYNVIQWVHRSTRGWSYGGGVRDPRTGEMIKGHVSLGSLRVRQDRLLFEGLAGTARTGTGGPDDPIQIALARIRQLAAHEVGHTLGFSHNFSASTYMDRASVMDYPAPLVQIRPDGELDFARAYGVGIGEWDVLAVRWLYSQFADGVDEDAELDRIIDDGLARSMFFHSDSDARPRGAAEPLASLWDNGSDAVAELARTLRVREIALGRFGQGNLPEGEPLAKLEEVLAPVYFHHRYQLDAAVKTVGGLDYRHRLRGDSQAPARPIAADLQRRALAAVLECLEPDVLDLRDDVLELLLPRPPGYGGNRELFGNRTSPAFDALGAAATAADQVVAGLLQRERCARLVDFHRRDPSLPSLDEVLGELVDSAFDGETPTDPRRAELHRVVQRVVADGLLRLARDSSAVPRVRARVEGALLALARSRSVSGDPDDAAHLASILREIERFLERGTGDGSVRTAPGEPPPGSPIGSWPAGCSQDPEWGTEAGRRL